MEKLETNQVLAVAEYSKANLLAYLFLRLFCCDSLLFHVWCFILFTMQVLTQFQKLEKCKQSDFVSLEALNEIDEMLGSPHEILKAPWEEGVCKVCGIDRDDDNVLLCDKCDAEYHKYCLDPPLAVIPEESWFCPSCEAGTSITQRAPDTWSNLLHRRKHQGEFTRAHLDFLAHLASDMEEREYWDLGVFQVCPPLASSVIDLHQIFGYSQL